MHKPLELPFRVRIWHFIRGLLFYNTVYWKRASDGLKPPKLSRKERQQRQPARNLEIIRPREHPRAHIVIAKGGQVSVPNLDALRAAAAEAAAALAEAAPAQIEGAETPTPEGLIEAAAEPEAQTTEVVVRRRKYRRRRNKVKAPPPAGPSATTPSKGLFGRIFQRK